MDRKTINTYIAFLLNAEFRKNLKYRDWIKLADTDERTSRQLDIAITEALNRYYEER